MSNGPQASAAPAARATLLSDLFGLAGKTAVVSGGTSGLGAAAARALALAGAHVVILGRDERRAAEVMAGIESAGGSCEPALADVGRAQEIEDAAARIFESNEAVDILVNAAGVYAGGPATDTSAEEWERVFAVNVTGTFLMCQVFGREMIRRGSGKIVNFASTDGVVGVPDQVAYCASKASVVQITRCLAAEWIKHGVNVNAVAPGEFATPMIGHLLDQPDYRDWVAQAIPAGRVGEPEELVGAVLFLVSKSSDMVVGHTLVVDGGRTVI